MKLNRTCGVLLVALASLGCGAVLAATTDTSSATTVPPARQWHHARSGMLVGTLLHATRQLNLTAAQQASIKSILATARTSWRSSAQGAADITVLGNPGHADYATAVQNAKSLAASRLERESALATQIYDVLSNEQKAQLPTVLAAMQAKAAQRRAAWQQAHASSTASGN